MIRLVKNKDHNHVLRLLEKDHAINLIMIFDVQTYGIDNQGHLFQGDYYGVFKNGLLQGVACLFNFGSLFFYVSDECLLPSLLERMVALERKPAYLVAPADWGKRALSEFEAHGVKPETIYEQQALGLTRASFKPRHAPGVRFARPDDLANLIGLHREFQKEYFNRLTEAEEDMGRMALDRMADFGIAVMEKDERLIAKAEVIVCSSRMAQVGGVYTEPQYRSQGYASACMTLLCEQILKEKKKVILNVAADNRPAMAVYKGLGFEWMYDTLLAVFSEEKVVIER